MDLTLFRKNHIRELYKHVDKIIERNNMNVLFPQDVPKHLKKEGVILALKKMHKDNYFSVCVINQLYEFHNLKISPERRQFYRTLHCVDWGDMSDEMKESLTAMIFTDLKPVLIDE
jgi:hypothetical protein